MAIYSKILMTSMSMTFNDEFNALSASASGMGVTWRTTLRGQRTLGANAETEYYSDSSVGVNPFSISNGVLDITAAPGKNLPYGLTYTSGALTTQYSFSQLYGYFEMRAELPSGAGMWPAFWLLPADGSWPPELDVVEMLGNDPGTLYETLHSNKQGTTGYSVDVPDVSLAFHTYGVLWSATTVSWYFDGRLIAAAATPADMHKAMFMLVNLAVGGYGSWPGPAAGETGHMLVDYVRAYQLPAAMIARTPTLGMLAGTVRIDVTATGAVASTAPGLGGVVVSLLTSSGRFTGLVAITDQNGGYSFGAIAAGTYQVVFNPKASYGILSDAGTVTVQAGGALLTADAVVQPLRQTIDFNNDQVIGGDGDYIVTGTGSSARVMLGDGDQTVSLTGQYDIIFVGDGASSITLRGDAGSLMLGQGASTVNVVGSGTRIACGGTLGADVVNISITGQSETILASDDGNFVITQTGGSGNKVVLLDGNNTVTLSGYYNTVTVGTGSNVITLGGGIAGGAVVHAGDGDDIISVSGSRNLIDGGAGNNLLIGGAGNDTFILHGAGQGLDRIAGFGLRNGDMLDMTRTLAGTAIAADLTNIGRFVSAVTAGGSTTLYVDPTGGRGAADAFAVLQGVSTTLAALVAQHDIVIGNLRS